MTISSQVRTAGPFTGNGVATGGPFTFKIFNATEMTVVQTTDLGVDSTLVYGVGFNITLNPDQNAAPGGTINYLIAGVGPSLIPTNYKLNATSNVSNLQPVALTNAGGFFPKVINDALDRLTILVQQVIRAVNASLQFPLSDGTGISNILPNKTARLGRVLAFDAATGAPIMSNQTLAQLEAGSSSAAASAAAALADRLLADADVVLTHADVVLTHADVVTTAASVVLASQWASQTSGIVAATDFSAKAWAIGGTNVTNTAARGASKEWATLTTGTVDTAEYSAKAYAIGGTGITNVATKGSAKDWATLITGTVDSVNYSAKAWAIGGTGVTNTASAGASKEWATLTTGAVDTAEYSAKAYAIGGTGVTTTAGKGSAKDWATKTNGLVDTADLSAKAWAIGGTSITDGCAKNWAQQTGADVTGATALSRSAKSWAQDNLTGATYGGSAKDWASSASLPDGVLKSSKSYATDSQTSATASAASATAAAARTLTAFAASKTFAVGDQDQTWQYTSTGGHTATIPTNAAQAFAVGAEIEVVNSSSNSSSLALAASSGVTINNTVSPATGISLPYGYGGVFKKTATNTWLYVGTFANEWV